MEAPVEHRFYGELADWWPLISQPEEYAEEAAECARHLRSAAIPVREVLELGSGGGNNAVHLTSSFAMTLVDLSEAMLAVSRRLNPGAEHHQGDMRSVRLGRQFDAVFVHDAVSYMLTEDDLAAAMATAFAHTAPAVWPCSCRTRPARRSPPVPITAATTPPTGGRSAISSGAGIPIPTTRGRSPSTPSCCAMPTARSASSHETPPHGPVRPRGLATAARRRRLPPPRRDRGDHRGPPTPRALHRPPPPVTTSRSLGSATSSESCDARTTVSSRRDERDVRRVERAADRRPARPRDSRVSEFRASEAIRTVRSSGRRRGRGRLPTGPTSRGSRGGSGRARRAPAGPPATSARRRPRGRSAAVSRRWRR